MAMRQSIWPWWLALVVAFSAIAAGVYFLAYPGREEPTAAANQQAPLERPLPEAPAEPAPPPARPPEPAPAQEPAATPEPLPPIDRSDEALTETASELAGPDEVEQFLVPDDIVRHLVATVDNLPRRKAAVRLRPVRPTPGRFLTAGSDDEIVLDPANYARYRPFVRVVEKIDTQALVAAYSRFYPLFQQAYQDLGYPNGSFNRRVIAVIDDLLETPDVEEPVKLVRPNVFYEFADKDLESRSAGQKLLLRMGKDNADVVKAKLQEIRAALVKPTTEEGRAPEAPGGNPADGGATPDR
jgi:hypothetical protein